jgi:hypothetical protein
VIVVMPISDWRGISMSNPPSTSLENQPTREAGTHLAFSASEVLAAFPVNGSPFR